MNIDLGGLLSSVLGGSASQEDHYHQVAQQASPDVLQAGLAAAFNSSQTPPFADMVAQMFGNASGSQRGAILGQLAEVLGPAAIAAIARGGAVGNFDPSHPTLGLDPHQVSPDQVQAMAEAAHQHGGDDVVGAMSGFFAQHSGLVKTLGSAALTIALSKMADHVGSR